jgi:glycerol-3-phosphate cytidylyltransferase
MRKVITYGTYDLLHQGHINLLRRAKEQGDYLIVGVTSDSYDKDRGKLNVRNNVLERVESVKATGYADEVIIEDYIGQKIDDIQKYGVDVFAIGSDWEGKFDYLKEYCDVVYLPRTEGISSTQLRAESTPIIKIGIVGCGRIAKRFVPEAKMVNGIEIKSVFNPEICDAQVFAKEYELKLFDDYINFLDSVDAVYIASPHLTHFEYTKTALINGKHVLCEIPFVLSGEEAIELYNLAEENSLVLLEASKTAHCPAWNHLLVLVKSGVIGDVVDVKASLSKLVPQGVRELDAEQAGGSMTELSPFPLMAIIKLLGTNYTDINFYSKMSGGVDIFTKANISYENAVASITLGLGVKTEGNLVISGTKGYILVPSPWWLTNYFEVNFEDRNKNKKYFYSYDGDGLRYEIQEFISMIINKRSSSYRLNKHESECIAKIIGEYRSGNNLTILK